MNSVRRPSVVLGCGRSGTSLLAGTLAASGYGLGDGLLRADASNPKGFFESRRVNDLNEALLAPLTDGAPMTDAGRPLTRRPLRQGERWLAALAPDTEIPVQPGLQEELDDALQVPPGSSLARKDPRFTWTLPAWPSPLADAVRLCVVRHPLAAARSILAMTDQGDLGLTLDGALAVWSAFYRRAKHLAARDSAPWVFVHFDQLVDGTGYARISEVLGVDLSLAFLDTALRRTQHDGDVPTQIASLHDDLRDLARR